MQIFYFDQHIFNIDSLIKDLEDKGFDCENHNKTNKQLQTNSKNLEKDSIKCIFRRNLKILHYPIDTKYVIIRIARNNGFIIQNIMQNRLVFEYNPIQIKCDSYK